jgi:hypothetical protein
VISDFAFQFRSGLSLWFCVSLTAYEGYLWYVRVMESLNSDSPDQMQVMIPRWVYNRIVTLLVAVQSGAAPEDYIVAVLEGHVRRLNL